MERAARGVGSPGYYLRSPIQSPNGMGLHQRERAFDLPMEKPMKHLVLLALLLVAAAFYIAGSTTGAVALVGVGVLLEFGFWFGLIQKRRSKSRLT